MIDVRQKPLVVQLGMGALMLWTGYKAVTNVVSIGENVANSVFGQPELGPLVLFNAAVIANGIAGKYDPFAKAAFFVVGAAYPLGVLLNDPMGVVERISAYSLAALVSRSVGHMANEVLNALPNFV